MKAHENDRLGAHGSASASRRRPLLFLLIAVLVIGALGFALSALLRSTEPTVPTAAEISDTPSTSGAMPAQAPAQPVTNPDVAGPTVESAPPLPELEHSDPEVRASLGDILPATAQPSLQPDELLRRSSVQIDGFAHGKLLRDKLPLPAVPGKLVVEERGEQRFLSPANFTRYDALGDALAELDTDALASWFNRYEPLLQQAVSELGNGDRNIRRLVLAGLDLMLAAPAPGGEIELVRPSVFYKFADPALEALPETQKLLIRMGPRNRELVLERVRKLRESLGS